MITQLRDLITEAEEDEKDFCRREHSLFHLTFPRLSKDTIEGQDEIPCSREKIQQLDVIHQELVELETIAGLRDIVQLSSSHHSNLKKQKDARKTLLDTTKRGLKMCDTIPANDPKNYPPTSILPQEKRLHIPCRPAPQLYTAPSYQPSLMRVNDSASVSSSPESSVEVQKFSYRNSLVSSPSSCIVPFLNPLRVDASDDDLKTLLPTVQMTLGLLTNTLTCSQCAYRRLSIEPFRILTLNIPSYQTSSSPADTKYSPVTEEEESYEGWMSSSNTSLATSVPNSSNAVPPVHLEELLDFFTRVSSSLILT